MPCLLPLLVVFFPRIAILLLYFFTTFFAHFRDNILIPLLGFIFLPVTLIAYTWMYNNRQPHDSTFLIVLIVAVVLDLGLLGGGHYSRSNGSDPVSLRRRRTVDRAHGIPPPPRDVGSAFVFLFAFVFLAFWWSGSAAVRIGPGGWAVRLTRPIAFRG